MIKLWTSRVAGYVQPDSKTWVVFYHGLYSNPNDAHRAASSYKHDSLVEVPGWRDTCVEVHSVRVEEVRLTPHGDLRDFYINQRILMMRAENPFK